MHVPDGFIDLTTSAATGVAAAGAVAVALRKAAPEIRENGPALAGLVSAFIFAVQMVNFPVGAGTSGHLLGGVLAVALVGPWTALLCMTTVLTIQAVLFADGGLTALGTNIVVMGVIPIVVGVLVIRGLTAVLPRTKRSVIGAAITAAAIAVPCAAMAFTLLYAIGGTVELPIGTVAVAMLGWHVLIGIGEAVITGAVLSAVLATRPDLMFAARHLRRELDVLDADGTRRTVTADSPAPSTGMGARAATTLLVVSLAIGGGLSYLASSHPDGLEYVGAQLGFTDQHSATAASPVADYAVAGIQSTFVAGGLAGVVGVLATVLIGVGLSWTVKRVNRRGTTARPEPVAADTPLR